MVGSFMRAAFVAAVVQNVALAQGPSAAGTSAADSSRIVRGAHSAQSSFELFRRGRLPERSGGMGVCDARIGQYCYWRGDDDDEQQPPDKPEVALRRDQLIATLDTASHTLAGDQWLAGQFVRYLAEAGRNDEAIRFARIECRASRTWCAALAGYAAHTGGQFAAADSEFSSALATMDPGDRSRWMDISDLLGGELLDRYESQGLEGREALARRVLWLGSPLLSVSGTDRLTEQFARFTRARMSEHATSTDGASWSDPLNELTMRYGWSTWYSRARPDMGSMREPQITGHDSGRPYDFLPSLHAVDHIGAMREDDWSLDYAKALNGYAPRFARSVHDLPHQIALFRRGESTLVVAAWDARRDTSLLGRTLDAALVVGSDPEHMIVTKASDTRTTGHISATAVVDSGLVSLELLATADRRAARARVGVPSRMSTKITLSDLLLYAATSESPHSLDVARDSALGSEIIPMSRNVGVFWETYGLPAASAPAHYTLTLEPIDVSWLRHVAEALRFTDPTRALRIQWDDVPLMTNGIGGRGVRIDVSQLRPARYRLRVTVDVPGELSAFSEREVVVR